MMPRVYMPKAVRMFRDAEVKRQESWAVGHSDPGTNDTEIGMKAGPFYNKMDALEEIGDVGDVIVHFMEDGTDELEYRWNDDMMSWVKEE